MSRLKKTAIKGNVPIMEPLDSAMNDNNHRERSVNQYILGKKHDPYETAKNSLLLAGTAGALGLAYRGVKGLRKKAGTSPDLNDIGTYNDTEDEKAEEENKKTNVSATPRHFFSPNSYDNGSLIEIKDPKLREAHGGDVSRLDKN